MLKKGYKVHSNALETQRCFEGMMAQQTLQHGEGFNRGDCAVWIKVPCALQGGDGLRSWH